MGFLRSYAAIGWTSTGDTAPTRVHLLGVPLRMTRPALSQATYRAQSLDRTVIESLVIPSGAHELIGDVRYDQDSQGLLDMLAAGSANKTLTYYPDVRDPTQSYTCQLISPVGPEIETLNDPQRATFGDTTVQIRLRRTDQSAFTEQYVGTNVLFWYRGGGSLQGFTFTRATAAAQIGPGRGLYTAAASGKGATSWVDLDGDGYREYPALDFSPARTNLCLQSENFGTTWSATGSPTRSAAAKTCGTVNLDLIGDDAGGALEYYSQTITFTGSAVKSISIHAAAGTIQAAGGWLLELFDSTAGADRLLGTLTWTSGGVPSVTMSTGVYLGYERLGNGVYRLHFQTTSVTATNTNILLVGGARVTNEQGNVYVGGVQAENAVYAGPYIPTTTGSATRNQDAVSAVFNAQPQALTCYVRFIERGSVKDASTVGRLLLIGGTSGARLRIAASGPQWSIVHFNSAGSFVASVATALPALGDVVELVGVLNTDGSVQLTQVINGVSATASVSGAQPLADAWSAQTIAFGESGANALAHVVNACVIRGAQSLDTMRRLARVTQV